ncbi:MAG: hypothetical protein QOH43_773 [Solirubrobacteraceae bacterium]|jgi:hypothetical protein|nr:hypothetical protein [Solirubrobacteraceae bacterium]
MIERHRRFLAASGAALLAALGVGGVAVAQNAASTPKPAPAAVQSTPASESPSAPDTDSVQSGDQTTPDAPSAGATAKAPNKAPSAVAAQSPSGAPEAPGTEAAPGTESATPETPGQESSGSEVPGADGPGGHADEPGNPNADHQFQGQE